MTDIFKFIVLVPTHDPDKVNQAFKIMNQAVKDISEETGLKHVGLLAGKEEND
jgi:hypothetical protein